MWEGAAPSHIYSSVLQLLLKILHLPPNPLYLPLPSIREIVSKLDASGSIHHIDS
jgi:hypothetical protein